MTEQLEQRLRAYTPNAVLTAAVDWQTAIADAQEAADTLKRYREALLAYCEAYDTFTGTVYVNAQIRQALSDS